MIGYDGEMIGPDGTVRYYPRWLHNQLHRINHVLGSQGLPILELSDKRQNLWRILPRAVKLLRPLWESPHWNPHRSLRALNCEDPSFRPRDSGPTTMMHLILGGLPVNYDRMRRDEEELGGMDSPVVQGAENAKMVAEIKQRRRYR